MIAHFTRLLESVVAAPETRPDALDMSAPEENSLPTREIHIAELDAGFAL